MKDISIKLDEKDRKILMILQKNARENLTVIARQVGLSIDSVHKRIKKMQKANVFQQSIKINPVIVGYPLVSDIRIRLRNTHAAKVDKMISYLRAHPNIINLFRMMGEWDIICVMVGKDAPDLNKTSLEIRDKFADIISDWRSCLQLELLKFEHYDMTKL
jgi:DNA-binding Lrp family transcriptional regulator